jgi:hypothetical protein
MSQFAHDAHARNEPFNEHVHQVFLLPLMQTLNLAFPVIRLRRGHIV